jgi:signal transduction histidine kinase
MDRFASVTMSSKNGHHSSGIFRTVRVVWAAVFILLLTLAVARLAGGVIQAVAGEYLVGLGQPAVPSYIPHESFYLYLIALRYAALAVFWLVALLIFWRRPDDWIASLVSWVLLLTPFSLVLGGEDAPWETMLTFLGLALFLLLLFIFPNGRFIPQSTTGRILLLSILLVAPFLAVALIVILRLDYPPEEQGYFAFLFALAAAIACGVASQVYRFRFVANSAERQQTRWVLFGLSAQLVWILWGLLFAALLLSDIINESIWALLTLHINILVPLMIPATFGIAMLRDGLWKIDPLINRVFVYATLTAIIVSLYILIVGALGALFQSRGGLLVALVATGAVAVIFQPLRDRLQKAANRLMYGERDDPVGMLTRLAKQNEMADDLETILPALVETVAVSLKFPYVAILLPGENGEAWKTAANVGKRPARVELVPLRYENREIGRLEVAPRSSRERLAEADRLLLVNIAQLAATTIRTLELNEQLKQSRRQLVAAREEERRRIRRDLHDGLGPVLAALTLQADTAVDLVYDDPDEAVTVLKKIRTRAQTAVVDIRHLVYGLRPPALDELGLTGAIRQYMTSLEPNDLTFTVEVPDLLPVLPAAVEVAAYRIAQEAISNVTRHAQASLCAVSLFLDGDLCLEIIDDGIGIPEDRSPGIGLLSMQERAAELGGTCMIESPSGGGARVLARLPINGQKE